MSTNAGARPGDQDAFCSICGHKWKLSAMRHIGQGQVACPDDYEGWHNQQTARAAAKDRPFPPPIKPRRRIFVGSEVPEYNMAEGAILQLLLSPRLGRWRYLNVTSGDGAGHFEDESVLAAGWQGVYLGRLVAENRRPTPLVTSAKLRLLEICDWLLSRQIGNPLADADIVPIMAVSGDELGSSNAMFGGFAQLANASEGSIYAEVQGAAGLALVYAHRATGTVKYLGGARRAAACIRAFQSGGRLVANYSTTTPAGSRYHPGMWVNTAGILDNAPWAATFGHLYTPSDLVALEFLHELKATDGDRTYGIAAAAGDFAEATAATLSTMLAEAKAFWTGGVVDAVDNVVKAGFSSATPFESFSAYDSTGGGLGVWRYATFDETVAGRTFAIGLRAWHAVYGYDATVADIWAWLMSFTANASPADLDNSGAPAAAGVLGTYDPTLALATHLRVFQGDAAVKMNHTAVYEWATTGLLAAIQSAQNQAAFVRAKETISVPRFRHRGTVRERTEYLHLRGRSGLGFQLELVDHAEFGLDHAGLQTIDSVAMAQAGLAYREAPQIFGHQGN